MAAQIINNRMKFKDSARRWRKLTDGCVFDPSGWGSVKEMQKELMRRFPDRHNRRTRKIPNGLVRVDGPWNDRHTQVITLI